MAQDIDIETHYRHGDLLSAIEAGLHRSGIQPGTVSVEDLGPVDEFHIGGRAATIHFLGQLELKKGSKNLDIGCGLCGASRFAATAYRTKMTGIDLTAEYVDTGNALNGWVGLQDDVQLVQGSALDTGFDEASIDGAFMMHVGMNIQNKAQLFEEIARVLKPGAVFGIYDIMQLLPAPLSYPLPWSSHEETSWVAAPDAYAAGLTGAGFAVQTINNRQEFAKGFFAKVKAANSARRGPPPLGLHTLMQATAPQKLSNMIASVEAGVLAPVEIISKKL